MHPAAREEAREQADVSRSADVGADVAHQAAHHGVLLKGIFEHGGDVGDVGFLGGEELESHERERGLTRLRLDELRGKLGGGGGGLKSCTVS